MIDPELQATVERLCAAGTVFDSVIVYLPTRKPIPPGVDFLALGEDTWDVDWVPTFDILSGDHPEAKFVAEQAARFYADPGYAKRLSDAAAEIDMTVQEANTRYDEGDWETT